MMMVTLIEVLSYMKKYLVGGAVRDQLLGMPVKERDWVVVGATVEDMLKLGYRQVGKEFPVFLHPKTGEEYALARIEHKVEAGYTGFDFNASPEVTLKEDLRRRDLTINAMAMSEEGELIDPYHGKQDLENKILRHVSPAFVEDPVRILRVGRFLARYADRGFTVAAATNIFMQQMVNMGEVDALVPERVWKELERALREPHPEKFFEVLADCQALPRLFPSIEMDSAALRTLKAAVTVSDQSLIRFAALMYTTPEANTLCCRYRVPNAYQELVTLIVLHHKKLLPAKTAAANALLHLFNSIDIFRREKRFTHILLVCQAIALEEQQTFAADWLLGCAKAAKSVNVQTLIAQGLKGEALAAKIKEKRLEKIEEWIAQRR